MFSRSLCNTSHRLVARTASRTALPTRTRKNMFYHTQEPLCMAMKPGTPIPGLDIYKEKDPPVVLERSEYPEWLGELVTPLKGIAQYRKMKAEEASLEDQQRYLKIIRKLDIKDKNDEARKK
mmetsp:Transcript_5334/g.6971  ORF Transcript_5334/g.6971 Transcript_5334/m.6971 type:complete len:122 (+) Transcript_5334:234-599(+)